jgi:DNA-binding response OmpR family regulator
MNANATAHDQSGTGPHVLVVDDDPDIGSLLDRYLTGQGLRVTVVASGVQLRAAMQATPVDLVLLDLGLPGEDGIDVMRDLRGHWQGPVIIVSGRGESVERIVGLELGADDYVTKPFDLRELLARIRSVLRRAKGVGAAAPNDVQGFEFDGLRLEVAARRLTDRQGSDIPLTTGEFELLLALLQRSRQVLSRDQLMNAVHGRDNGPFDRAIDVQIGRLRRKLESDPLHPQRIKSVRGVGYMVAVGWRGLEVDLYAVFPRGEVQSPKVRAFIDFLLERLDFDESFMRAFIEEAKPHPAREAVAEVQPQ